jgi:acetyl-CoA acetyltransferase
MDVYASLAKFHMRTYGTTQEQIALIAAKNHRHSTLNPLAQYQRDITVEEVMRARVIAWPLTLPMCAAIGDGASAVVVCGRLALDRFEGSRAVRVRASTLCGSSDRPAEDLARHVGRIAALKAYEEAGIGPEDISVAEVHDATSFGEIQQTENLGLCPIGEGGRFAATGATSLGGRVPVNPSGGLVSKGHPVGATGLAQVHELVTQLRGEAGARQVEGARLAIAENGGGFYGVEEAVACVTILGD